LPGESKVGQLEHAVFLKEQVAHLEVPVHHLILMQLNESGD